MAGFSVGPSSQNQFADIGQHGGNSQFPKLDKNTITDFVSQFSSEIRYWKAIRCPCVNIKTESRDINCVNCKGTGYYHQDYEKDPIYQKAQVHSRNTKKNQNKSGVAHQGSCSVTFMPGVIPADGDIVQVCKDIEVINNEFHVIGSKFSNGLTAERLRFREVLCVESVAIQNKNSGEIIILDKSDWSYNEATKKIDFSKMFRDGTVYTLRYLARPEYIILGESVQPMLRITKDDAMPMPDQLNTDLVYPYFCQMVRLDKAVVQEQVAPKSGDGIFV